MNCIKDSISIRGLCSNDTAKYYLDDIGISLLSASKIADERYGSGRKMIETKINQAWEMAFNDITFDGFISNKILLDSDVGDVSDNTVSIVGTNNLKLSLSDKCKPLSRIFINKIIVNVASGGTTIIKLNGSEMYNATTLDNDIITISINDYIPDNSIISIGGDFIPYSVINDSGSNLFSINNSELFGITIQLQIRCDNREYLCRFADKIAVAVQYKASALIWKEVMDSNRFNDFLSIKKDVAVAQMAWLDSDYNLLKYDPATESTYSPKGMYQKELKKLNIPVPNCPCCMECGGDRYTMVLP